MGDIRTLARSLREFDADAKLIKEVAAELRKPVPIVRARIKNTAIAILPHAGGLNVWVSQTRITAAVNLRGRAANVRLRGGRRSVGNLRGTAGGVTDVRAIDRGRVRHPSWGRRWRGQWWTQSVPDGFFTKTSADSPEWEAAIMAAGDHAFASIHA